MHWTYPRYPVLSRLSRMAYQSEIEKLEQRFREKPEQWFAALADAYRKAGEVERALDVVRAGLEKRPNYTSGHIVLGRCLLDQINDPEASQAFERVLELDAENIIALKALSEIAERQGDRRAARGWLERLLDVDPMNDEARTALETIEVEGIDEEVAAPAPEVPPEPEPVPEVAHPEEPRTVEVEQRFVAASEAPTGPTEALEVEEAIEEEELELETPELAAKISDEFPVPDFETAEPEELLIPEATIEQPPLEEIELERASDYDQEVPEVEMEPISLERVPEAEFEPPIAEFLSPEAELVVEGEPEVEERVWAQEEETVDTAAETLEVTPFDEELAWGAGERISREITEEDLEEAEKAHEESLEAAARYIPGLEYAEVPDIGEPEFEEEVEEPSEPEAPPRDAAAVAEQEAPPAPEIPAEEPVATDMSGESWGPAELEAPAETPEAPEEVTPPAAPPEELVAELESLRPPAIEPEEPAVAEVTPEEPAVPQAPAAPAPEPILPITPVEEPAPVAAAAELPLIMPDEEPAEQPEEEAQEPEPEPVLTETMAEVYARQGLFGEARHIYEQMLTRRPGDPELLRRLDELDTRVLPKRREEPDLRARFAASSTGGQPLRAMLRDVASAKPPADVMAAIHGAPPAPAPEAPPQREPSAGTGLDAVFGEEAGEPAAPPGSMAEEDVSLASVFGEEPAPVPKPKAAVPTPTEAPAPPGPSSYEEFFGGGPKPGTETEDTGESAPEGEEGEEGFQDWLEGLKT